MNRAFISVSSSPGPMRAHLPLRLGALLRAQTRAALIAPGARALDPPGIGLPIFFVHHPAPVLSRRREPLKHGETLTIEPPGLHRMRVNSTGSQRPNGVRENRRR